VLQGKVFVWKFFTVDRFTAGAVAAGEVSPLKHEIGDNAMELTTLKPKAFFAGAESTKVLGGFWHNVGEQVELDATSRLAAHRDIEVNLGIVGHLVVGCRTGARRIVPSILIRVLNK